ncbi:hypothetical protein WJX84_003211 [Apatococcus fuscideae]|uniref:Uncharacterized protein n=1 Tax=Apatococcus fuscideae TaxID=2026836 RepID=A0AAW1SVX5_9CHLO
MRSGLSTWRKRWRRLAWITMLFQFKLPELTVSCGQLAIISRKWGVFRYSGVMSMLPYLMSLHLPAIRKVLGPSCL